MARDAISCSARCCARHATSMSGTSYGPPKSRAYCSASGAGSGVRTRSGTSWSKPGAAATSSAHSKLTALQREVLDAFFQRERGFFLTRGAAIVGFYLGHRTTDDLDLFTSQPAAFEQIG